MKKTGLTFKLSKLTLMIKLITLEKMEKNTPNVWKNFKSLRHENINMLFYKFVENVFLVKLLRKKWILNINVQI